MSIETSSHLQNKVDPLQEIFDKEDKSYQKEEKKLFQEVKTSVEKKKIIEEQAENKIPEWRNICESMSPERKESFLSLTDIEKKELLKLVYEDLLLTKKPAEITNAMIAQALEKQLQIVKEEVTQNLADDIESLSKEDELFLKEAQEFKTFIESNKDFLAQIEKRSPQYVPSLFYPRTSAGIDFSARGSFGSAELNIKSQVVPTGGVTVLQSFPFSSEKNDEGKVTSYGNTEGVTKGSVTYRNYDGVDNPENPQKRFFKGSDVVLDLQAGVLRRIGEDGKVALSVTFGPQLNIPVSQETRVVGPNGEKKDVVTDIFNGENITSHTPTTKKISLGTGGEFALHKKFEYGPKNSRYMTMSGGLLVNMVFNDNLLGRSRKGLDPRVASGAGGAGTVAVPDRNNSLNGNAGFFLNFTFPLGKQKPIKGGGGSAN